MLTSTTRFKMMVVNIIYILRYLENYGIIIIKQVSAIHASMLSSSPGSQASPSTTSGGPNMTPNASIAGSLTPSSLAAGGATITGSSAKTGSSGTNEQLPGSSSSVPQNNIASSANKQGSKKNSNSASSGSAATLGGNTSGGAAGNKKVCTQKITNSLIFTYLNDFGLRFSTWSHSIFIHIELEQRRKNVSPCKEYI